MTTHLATANWMKKVDSDRLITVACIQVIIHANIISISNDFIFKLSANSYLETRLGVEKAVSNHWPLQPTKKEAEEEKKKGKKKRKENYKK